MQCMYVGLLIQNPYESGLIYCPPSITSGSARLSKAICLRDSAAAIRIWETSAFSGATGDRLHGVLVTELGSGLAESRFGF